MYDVIIQLELDMNIVLHVIPRACAILKRYLCLKLTREIVLQQFKYDGLQGIWGSLISQLVWQISRIPAWFMALGSGSSR